jgi:endonuclease-3 related protein
LRCLGPQRWWPARTPFEVCVGAVLTQNTAWTNVERAIANLRHAEALSPRGLLGLPRPALARLLRPAGSFNVKERRLRSFVRFLAEGFGGSVARMRRQELEPLRARLLGVHGVGRETADSILCYAAEKPIFAVDAYTRRVFSRHGWIRGDEDYDEIRALVERDWAGLPAARRTRDFNEFHALLVALGKDFCRPRNPRCATCPLRPLLPTSGICR